MCTHSPAYVELSVVDYTDADGGCSTVTVDEDCENVGDVGFGRETVSLLHPKADIFIYGLFGMYVDVQLLG